MLFVDILFGGCGVLAYCGVGVFGDDCCGVWVVMLLLKVLYCYVCYMVVL